MRDVQAIAARQSAPRLLQFFPEFPKRSLTSSIENRSDRHFSRHRTMRPGPMKRSYGRRRECDQIKFFTIADVAERLDVVTRTVRRWVKSGDLLVHRFGGVV